MNLRKILLVACLSMLFFTKAKVLIFLALFCIGNAVVLSINRYIDIPHDFELSTFASVLFSVSYGLFWGIAIALLTKITEILYNKDIVVDDISAVVAFVLAAILGYYLRFIEIVLLGLLVTIIINIFNYFVSKYMVGLTNVEITMQTITNVILNFILFFGFARFMLLIM